MRANDVQVGLTGPVGHLGALGGSLWADRFWADRFGRIALGGSLWADRFGRIALGGGWVRRRRVRYRRPTRRGGRRRLRLVWVGRGRRGAWAAAGSRRCGR